MLDPVTHEPEQTTEQVRQEVIDAGKPAVAVAEPVVETPVVEEPKVEAPVVPVVDKSAEAISQINQTLAKQTELLNTLANKVDAKAEEKEWTLEQLREAEAKVYAGEYEQKWLPLINEKRATIIAKQIANEKAEGFIQQAAKNEFQQKWDNGVVQAANIFGKDVSDTQSALFKTAQDILLKDPTWQQYQKTGDTKYIDPNLQLKCFELAHSRLVRQEKDAPKVPSKGTSKVALGGPTLPKPDSERFQKLEEIATNDPNNTHAWMQLMKEGMRKNRGQ